MHEESDVIAKVSRALGRSTPPRSVPAPPEIDETITRLVHTDIGLVELFTKIASDNKIGVTPIAADELVERLIEYLRGKKVRTIALAVSPLLDRLGVLDALRKAGFDARTWDQLTLDDLYDIDCGLTDVWSAVAEVGALVIRGSPQQGRAISLIPPLHVAIVEPKNLLADLVDLFQKLPADQNDRFAIITGPSKTADIEMNLVTGVHGPGVVQVFLLT